MCLEKATWSVAPPTGFRLYSFLACSLGCDGVTPIRQDTTREESVTPTTELAVKGHGTKLALLSGAWLSGQLETKRWKLTLRQTEWKINATENEFVFLILTHLLLPWDLLLDSCFSIHMHWINSPDFLYVTVMPTLLIQEDTEKVRITIIYLVSER